MKKYFLLTILLMYGCNNVIGSDDDTELNNLEFTQIVKAVSDSELTVTGQVKNTGTTKVSSPWYVEGMFYTDTTFTFILGGDNQRQNVPLEPEVSISWTLSYSSSEVLESDYPNFGFRNLRGFTKN